ncbi:murein L,D-transpeptidase [bacterium]|nr:MAG: murein L,D-transpeptidase [bacterium]
MRLFRIIIFTSIISTLVLPGRQAVAKPNLETQEPFRGSSICTPGSDPIDDCVLNGPAKVQLDWQEKGLSYPLLGLPAYTPDPSYNELPYRYAAILADPKREVRLFPSLDDAVAAENQSGSIPAGALRWVAFTAQADVNGGHYVQLPDSFEWVRASPAEVVNFQGLAFYRTPDLEFGWLGDHTNSRTAPSLESPSTGTRYYRNSVVQIFGTDRGNEEDWIQIGINEWVESRFIKRVRINTNPPEGVTNNRWIEVNLYDQTLAVYDNRQLVYATMIASGLDPFFTKPGLFQIQKKLDTEKMTGAFESDRSDYYQLEKVPWTMYFDGARALHAAYWRTMFGFPQSHGCVNLAPGDAHFLYDWANVGDWVYVWDPSGLTPTDPAKYGEGGA